MKILSIDTASNICSVSILENNHVLIEKNIENQKTHSERLMPMIQEVLQETNLTLNNMDLFAVSKGPGSFTGIRIGISTIKAFSDALSIPALGITSLEGLAYNVDTDALIAVLLDAQNNNVYYGLFGKQGDTYTPIGSFLAEPITTILPLLTSFSEKIIFLGDGSMIHQELIHTTVKENAIFMSEDKSKAKASNIGKAAYYHYTNHCTETCILSPLYLKKSQAERALEESHGN